MIGRVSDRLAKLRLRLASIGGAAPGRVLAGRGLDHIAWNLLATLTNQGSSFVATIALARLLDAKDFGIYVAVLGTAQIATLVAGAGMGYTATKYVAEFARSDPARASRIFGFCLAGSATAAATLGLLIAVSAPWIAQHVFAAPPLAEPLRLAGGICFFMTVNAVLTGALAGMGAYRLLGLSGVASGLLYATLTISLSSGWGVTGAALGLLASGAAQTAVLAIALTRAQRLDSGVLPALAGASTERAVLLRFALPAAIAGIGTAASLWLGQVVLARNAGLVEIGLYSVAQNLLTITLLSPAVANTVGMSMLNSARGAGDRQRFDQVFRSNLYVTFVLVMVGAGTVAALGRPILAGFGPAFVAAYPALLVLLLAAVPESLGLALYQMLQSRERMWQAMRAVMLPRDVLLPLLALLLVPRLGALGLASAYLASRGVYLVMTAWTTRALNR